jgi:hypothetical protein
MADNPHSRPRTFSAEDTRQGEIVLRTRKRRIIFVAGLAGCVVLALLLAFFSGGRTGWP